ncbi:MAG: glycosyltransferase family A protein [Planctomycetota bacterium]|nr:glycosyltransferase family A protein [Planctomycetota bacterium]
MPAALVITAATFGIVGVLTGTYWLMVFGRMQRIARFTPRLAEGLAETGSEGRVSVVVPAHDEVRVIGRLVRTVLEQQGVDLELIIVLDRCTDGTADAIREAAAGDPRVRTLEIEECPEDWAGKCHAAERGAEIATGDWILFTDADVGFDPKALQAATSYAAAHDLDLLSAWTSLTAERWWEKVVQPAAAITLLRIYPPDRVNNDERPRSFANGQFMLFSRETYERIGRHAAVRERLLEDLAFAELVHAHGGRVRVVSAGPMVRTDMYSSLGSMLLGWRRILMEASKRNPRRVVTNAVLVLGSGLAPLLCWGGIVAGSLLVGFGIDPPLGLAAIITSAFGLLAQGFTLCWIFRSGRMPLVGVLGWAVGCAMVSATLLAASRDLGARRPVRWGGREYILESTTN